MKRALPGLILAALVLVAYADPLFTGLVFAGRDLLPLVGALVGMPQRSPR